MGQWFKKIVSFFTKRQPVKFQPLLEFNQERLAKDIESLALKIFDSRSEASIRLLKDYSTKMVATYLLEMSRSNTSRVETIAFFQGSVKACNDLMDFISSATNPEIMNKFIESKKGKQGARPPIRLAKAQDTVI